VSLKKSFQENSKVMKKLDYVALISYLLLWILIDGPRNSNPIIFGSVFFYHFIALLIALLVHIQIVKKRFKFSIFYLGYLVVLAIATCVLKILIERLLWKFCASSFDYSLTVITYEGSDFFKQYSSLFKSYLIFFLFHELINKVSIQESKSSKKELDKKVLFIKSNKEIIQIPIIDIFYFEGLKDYVKVYSKKGVHITKRTLISLEGELDNEMFLRVQKSYIVNRMYIEKLKGNRIEINGNDIPIGAAYKESIKKIFSI
jgi:LytTr DNA-binding domain